MASVESAEGQGDLGEREEAFVSVGGVLALADEPSVVVDPVVCAFHDRAARLDTERARRAVGTPTISTVSPCRAVA